MRVRKRPLRCVFRRVFLAPIDLVGRTSPARLHLRVRFGVTDESANVKRRPCRARLDLWTGGNA
jgi:hypothetical protein